MKRKVFSLMMLCLFAFLGMASAQQSGMSVTPDPIDLGYRPIGAWMRPFKVQFTATSTTAQTITSIEAENTFFVVDADLPGTVSSANPFNFTINHGEAEPGFISCNLVAMTSNRTAHLFDISAVAYNPIAADVVELAPAITLPFTATVGEGIYDNYLLPGNTPDGKDVVYKMTIEDDVLFAANVEGENGKIAVYTEDFSGEPGPGAENSYEGISTGGNAITPFEALIGDENSTSTSTYFPFYTLYNYSIAEQLYLAEELIEAGMNTLPIASLSFEATNETGKEEKNIRIWMANVSDSELTTTSYITGNMTLVFSGNIAPVVGWNEFVFNENQFVWDGSSNLLVCVERADGGWQSPSLKWKSHTTTFKGMAYAYRDPSAYGMDVNSYSMYNPYNNSRVNTMFKSVSGRSVINRDHLLADMTLTPGVYYLVASSTSEEFTVSANMDILPAPEQATNPSPADGQTGISMPAILTWEFGNYTTAYRVLLGTTYPPTNVVVDWTNELSSSLAVTNLHNNKNYFWRVDSKNSNGVTEGQIWGFTTTLNIPQDLTAVEEKIYEGDALELSWNTVSDRSSRGYNLYQDGVKINNEMLTVTEYTVNGLTYNMSDGYTFNVTAVYDEGESDFSEDLVAYVTGNGMISGKVCELDGVTGIPGAEVTFEGKDEYQRPATYTFTTGSNGMFTGNMLAGTYTGMVMKDGYQGAFYDGSIQINYNEITSNVNFIIQEILYPVGEVIAEQMSANQVKVYWSSNVMSEIIEDFETGDFSAFPWQNDATYPWSVVTTNPYEGNYCMKSGNESVNSSTSAIEVTVEIGRDGLMSFFQKISSESSYDKGHFYIDGSEKLTVSGAGSWQQKEYPITAGVHTFMWAYTKDSSVSSNDDCWYVDNISFVHDAEPVPEGTVYDFENGLDPWTSIDADGDGYGWEYGPDVLSGGYGHNSTEGFALSRSYVNYVGALTPDNYLVSPLVALGGSVTLYACGQDANYAAEHFGVAVSTTGTNPSDFTMLQEWTLTAKGERYSGTRGTREQGTWYQFTVDLSAYSGNGYVAIRHFNCTDMFYLNLDDVIISSEPAKTRAFNHYNVYRATEGNESAAELITSVTDTVFFDNEMANLEPGIYKWGVSTVYEGNRGSRDNESEIVWSNPIENKMYVTTEITVLNNAGESPEGATVVMTNISEPEMNLVYSVTLDETGYYMWDNMRRGSYNITINQEGFEPVDEVVEIGDENFLRYVLIEIIEPVTDLYVSGTGWAMFGDIPTPVDPDDPPTPPTEGQWYYYDNGEYATGIGTGGGQFKWGVMFTAGSYTGNQLTKVKVFDGSYPMTGDVTIYSGGSSEPGTAVGTMNVTFTGVEDFIELEFPNPVVIDPSQNLWVVFYNASGATYPAAASDDVTNDPNGRWVYLEDYGWMDCADAGVAGYSWMIRAYVGGGAKGEVEEITLNQQPCTAGTLAKVDNPNHRSVEYYIVKLNGELEGNTTHPFFQHNVENLVEGETYTTTVQKVYSTGMSDPISFDWVYTPCDNFEGLQSADAQWVGEDVVLTWVLPEGGDGPTPPPTPPTNVYDFEDGTMQGWTSLDADGDGFGWNMMSSFGTGYGHNGSIDGVFSQSYDNNYGVLYPDNYLVSPQVTLGGEIKFWACGQDASYVAEHFGVAVSTTTATAGAFTTIQEWTMTGKGNGAPTDVTRSGNRAQGSWHQYTVDLSAYAGQTGYVAIRHFNCSDMFYLDVDDIELGGGSGDDPNPPTPGANVRGVEIFRNGEWIAEVPATTTTFTDVAPGDVESYEIRVVYNGNLEDYTHYTMSCPEVLVPTEVVCIAPENLTGSYEYFNQDDFGAFINWTYSGEVNGSENHYDNGTYGTSIGLGGGQFQWAVMFPAGTYEGNTVTMVQAYDDRAMSGTVAIYTGASTPQTMIASTNIEFTGTGDWATFSFDEPVVVDPSQNIWVVIDNVSGTDYPAAASAETVSDPNGRWVAVSGSWMDLATAGVPGYCWMIRCFTSDLFFFQVFRNGELISEVPYDNSGEYTYYDRVAIGNYQYQVNAVSAECESEFALTPDGSQDYVEIHVTSVTENIETRVYPNPTTGIVNIEANGMSHLTVVNALGQIVFDTNISGDQYQMNLGQFKAGVYMVRITTEEGVSVKRVTVAK